MTIENTYNVLVLDSNKKFLKALKYALDRDAQSVSSFVNMVEVLDESQISHLDSEMIWSCIFIDSSFLNGQTIDCLNDALKKNPICKVILLISSKNGGEIKETINSIDSLEVEGGIDFILSDNLSDNMKVSQCLAFINKVLK